jgi:SAM-dependent methyltransferase
MVAFSADPVAETYDRIATRYAATFTTPADYLDDFLGLLPPRALVLDVGCGAGTDCAHCAAKGFRVEGIDLSAAMVALARQRNPHVAIQQADLIDFQGGVLYHACLASFVLVHLRKEKAVQALKNLGANLCADGWLYLSFHEGASQEILVDEPFDPRLKLFLAIYGDDEMRRLLDAAGFQIARSYDSAPPAEGGFPFREKIFFARKREGRLG